MLIVLSFIMCQIYCLVAFRCAVASEFCWGMGADHDAPPLGIDGSAPFPKGLWDLGFTMAGHHGEGFCFGLLKFAHELSLQRSLRKSFSFFAYCNHFRFCFS